MRIAILSDIHANLQAWRAVRTDLRSRGVDAVVCLGDVVGYGPSPGEVLEGVRAVTDNFVLGNHDAVAAGFLDWQDFDPITARLMHHAMEGLGNRACRSFRKVPLVLQNTIFSCSHGSPAEPALFMDVQNEQEAHTAWESTRYTVQFIGHTHLPAVFVLTPGGECESFRPGEDPVRVDPDCRYLINCGSVGMTREEAHHACYAIFDTDARSVTWRRLDYDRDAYAEAIRSTYHDPELVEFLLKQASDSAETSPAASSSPGTRRMPLSAGRRTEGDEEEQRAQSRPPRRAGCGTLKPIQKAQLVIPEPARQRILDTAHFLDYVAVVVRQWKLVAPVAIVALVLGFLKGSPEVPQYVATMTFRVRPGPDGGDGTLGSQVSVRTCCSVIEGPDFARRAAQELDIASRLDLGLAPKKPGGLSRLREWVKSFGSAPERSEGPGQKSGGPPDPEQFADILRSRISARPVRGTRLIHLTYRAADRGRTSRICRALAQYFIESERSRRLESAREWTNWYRNEQARFQRKVSRSEEALLEFRQKTDTYLGAGVGQGGEWTGTLERTLGTLRARREELRLAQIELQTRLTVLEKAGKRGSRGPGNAAFLENDATRQLLARRRDLERELAAKNMRYKPKHPVILRLKKSLAMVEQDFQQQREAGIQTLRGRLAVLEKELRRLHVEIRTARGRASEAIKNRFQYLALKRRARANWKFFDTFIQKAEESQISAGLESLNLDLISSEPRLSRVSDGPDHTVWLALLLGLGAGVGVAFVVDYMDTSLSSLADVQKKLDLEQLAMFLHGDSTDTGTRRWRRRKGKRNPPVLPAIEQPHSPLTENFRFLRSRILFNQQFQDSSVLLVTSSVPREGKSTIAANLAIVLAQVGKRVLLVDADMRRPAVHALLGAHKEPGLSDYLRGEAELESLVQPVEVENLDVLSCGSEVESPAEIIAAHQRRCRELANLSDRYDYVLVDTPPLVLSDPVLLAGALEGLVLLVVRSSAVSLDAVQEGIKRLKGADADVAGALFNDVDLCKQGHYKLYYHYYNSYYYQRYAGQKT